MDHNCSLKISRKLDQNVCLFQTNYLFNHNHPIFEEYSHHLSFHYLIFIQRLLNK
jgi:hypothetical protein